MTKPVLAEGEIHSGESSTSQHFLVGDFLLPSNFKNKAEIFHVKNPGFAIL